MVEDSRRGVSEESSNEHPVKDLGHGSGEGGVNEHLAFMGVGADYYGDVVRDGEVVGEGLTDVDVGPSGRGGDERRVVAVFFAIFVGEQACVDVFLLSIVGIELVDAVSLHLRD